VTEHYVILETTVVRNTSCNDAGGMPWLRRTRRAYIRPVDADRKLSTWPVAVSLSLRITPSTLRLLTLAMFGHGIGGWTDLPGLPRAVMIISLEFAQFNFRLGPNFVGGCPLGYVCYFSQTRSWVSSCTTRMMCVVGVLKDAVCWRHRMQVCCRYDLTTQDQCRALYDTGLLLPRQTNIDHSKAWRRFDIHIPQ